MASQYPSNQNYDGERSSDRVQPGISRARSHSDARSSDYRPRSGGRRSSGAYRSESGSVRRDARQSSSGQPRRSTSPSSGRRAPQGSGRRRQPPRRGGNGGFYAIIAVIAVVLIVGVVLILKPGKGIDHPAATTGPVVTVTRQPEATDFAAQESPTSAPTQYASIADMLGDSGNQVEGLAADQMVHVDGLSIKKGLPEEWLNVLLLGTDERTLAESARTDAMMICSINRNTGEVKLTSIMRDLAVQYTDIGEYNGTYRINAANYFGGPNLAMRTVNELFEMNIQYYVMINFFGFGRIAQRLGGVEVDISEAEMNKINEDIVKQFKMAYLAGYTDFDPDQKFLEQYGKDVHLNGNQTLAYARIRHLDGGDYMRTTRQQTVLKKLLEKLKKLGAMDMLQLGNDMFDMVKTNMELNDIFTIATLVVGNGLSDIDTFRLPVAKTYKEETRNDEGMLYDCDFATNAARLYDFIYE